MFNIFTELFDYIQQLMFQLVYTLGLYCVRGYLYIKDMYYNKNEEMSYVATYHHSHNEITEYEVTVKNNVHKLKFLNDDFNTFLQENNIGNILDNKNKILHCCLINKEGELLLDCTEELRSFRYYLTTTNEKLTWIMFLYHITSLHSEPIVLDNCILMLCKNDDDLSELNLDLQNYDLNSFIQI